MLWSSIIHQIISIFRPSVCQFSGMQKVPASQNVYSTTSYVITNFWYQKSKQLNFYQLWDHWNHMKLEIVGEKSPRPRVCQLHLHAVWLWVRKYLGRTQKIDNGTISPLSTPLQAVTMVPAVLNRIGAWTQWMNPIETGLRVLCFYTRPKIEDLYRALHFHVCLYVQQIFSRIR